MMRNDMWLRISCTVNAHTKRRRVSLFSRLKMRSGSVPPGYYNILPGVTR